MRIFDRIKTTTFAATCLILLIPNLIYMFPFLVNADRSYTVMGVSMTPTLRSGDLLIIKDVNPAEIEIGDIITVRYDDSSITHRLVEKIEGDPNYYMLKGDGKEEPDLGIFEESKILGKVVLVLPLSHLYTVYGFTLVVVVPFVLIVYSLRVGKIPRRDTRFLLLFFILVISSGLTISHYFFNLKAF